jgi:lipopolysaccharide export system protein LptA
MKKVLLTIMSLMIMLPASATTVTVESKKQTYDSTQNKTFLDGGVKVKMDDITITSPRAVVDITPQNEVDKATFLDKVYAIKDNHINQHEIKSDIMTMSLLNKKIKAEGNTISTFSEKRVPVVVMTANYQEFDVATNLMKAKGNVVIHYKDVVATSNEAQLKIDQNSQVDKMKLIGNAVVKQQNSILTANTVMYNAKSEEVVAKGNTHSHSTNDDGSAFDIYAGFQQYDKGTGSMMTSGCVRMTYQDYIATGPKATFLQDKKTKKMNKIIFYKRSKIQETDKIVEADKIVLTVNPKNFTAEGNVKTSFKNVKGFSDSKSNSGGSTFSFETKK